MSAASVTSDLFTPDCGCCRIRWAAAPTKSGVSFFGTVLVPSGLGLVTLRSAGPIGVPRSLLGSKYHTHLPFSIFQLVGPVLGIRICCNCIVIGRCTVSVTTALVELSEYSILSMWNDLNWVLFVPKQ